MTAPSTPKTNKKLSMGGSSNKKMKQSTLLSFFSKQSSPTSNPKVQSKKCSEYPSPTRDNERKDKSLFIDDEDNEKDQPVEDIDKKDTETATKAEERTAVSTETELKELTPENTPKIAEDKQEVENDENEEEQPTISSGRRRKRNISYTEDSEDDDEEVISTKKRRSAPVSDDDDEFTIASESEADEEVEEEFIPEKEHSSILDDDSDDDDILALSTNKYKKPTTTTPKPIIKKFTKSASVIPKKPATSTQSKNTAFTKQNEERYQWLVEERDAQKRPKDDPEYDPRTLYIPSSAWNKFTPFEKQYWEIKSKMWDCIVFFKKGKFFELYEKDAFLANALFDWKLAGGGRANMQLAGIPEMSFEHWAAQFIQLGYKVAKVDQRESMLAKEMREGSKGIVKRELQCVLTSGTLVDSDMIHSDLATYCLAIREEPSNFYDSTAPESPTYTRIFGVAFIDTSTGELQMIEFHDDDECSRLDTLMSQVKPKEIIMEKNNLSNLAHKIVKFCAAPHALFNYIKPAEEFYDAEKTYNELIANEEKYFKSSDQWPKTLIQYHENNKKVGLSAFGGLLYYLKWLKLDENLISMKNIKEYNFVKSQNSMVLDGISLQNLEIFSNSYDGSDKGTLFKLFNNAITAMGKRMMKKWLMHPLLMRSDIEKRQDSVDALMSDTELRNTMESTLSTLPDLERMLSRIHSGSLKVKDFDKVITAFEDIVLLVGEIKNHSMVGALQTYFSQIPKSLQEEVGKWKNAFDRRKAVEEGVIIPQPGVEPEFDKSLEKIESLEQELQSLLKSYMKLLKTSNIQYKDSGKEIYTIEIPVMASKYVPSSWVQMGANKSTKRYYSDEVRKLARLMAEARELHKTLEDDLKFRLCKKFDTNYDALWMPTVHSLSNIDCLIGLARTSEALGAPSCRPRFHDEIDETTGCKLNGFVDFKSLRHPCFNLDATTAKDFIPNDVSLGKGSPNLGLLTGANAAGKSTVLRMTCVAVIMAQMGCYVPAESADLTPVDRIMTRLGANDNIMQGKSTFFVELSETKKILDMASNRSLLVLDELGRGGSSNDGFSIAESVLHHVATHIQSLGFFATHYGTLGLSFKTHPQVKPMKMSILVDEKTRNVTFLYKLVEGQSEGSFGMHVAAMCGIPKSIVDNAQSAADNLEHTSQVIRERKAALHGKIDPNSLVPLGLQSDFVRLLFGDGLCNKTKGTGEGVHVYDRIVKGNVLKNIFGMIDRFDD
ncbi:DNA mismatch repair protein MSH6 [Nakaseomyces bracarensis]|uniref:DNA mismatch repair protein n=1 Tax=Nakaseomyces bracarensis TaxID=273131 RepID=A0ABR4NUE8_9SACH